jgi:RecA-family ATPase
MVRELGCCVRYVHHTGKSGRDLTDPNLMDQYAGRGGSALADGTRMTAVMATIEADKAPAEFRPREGDSLIALVRPKLSYASPQPTIWLRRRGFAFDHHIEHQESTDQRIERRKTAVLDFLEAGMEMSPPRRLTEKQIGEGFLSTIGMSRQEFREAIARLRADGRVTDAELPKEERHGQRKTFIAPVPSARWTPKWAAE